MNNALAEQELAEMRSLGEELLEGARLGRDDDANIVLKVKLKSGREITLKMQGLV